MTFIGVATTEKDADYIAKELESNLTDKSVKVININKNSIENIKNVKFETILVDDILINKEENLKNKSQILKKIINNSKNVILNSDIEENLNMIKDLSLSIITYGFNSKATITMSSLDEESMMVCIQRNIKLVDGSIIEQQELKMNINECKISDSQQLGMLATSLFYGKS